jgi:hypothetical protein
MCKPEFDPKDLTKEKSLWDIYLVSRRIPASVNIQPPNNYLKNIA